MNAKHIALIAAVAALTASTPSQAQSIFNRLVPGAATSSAASVDPDAFLAETVETTKFMTTGALILAYAAERRQNRDELRAQIEAVQSKNNVGELQSTSALLESSVQAVRDNAGTAELMQARYDEASAEQKQLLVGAAFNFALGLLRNVQLAQQAPTLMRNMAANPALLMKANSLRQAGSLIAVQGRAAQTMWGPLRAIMARGGVQVPTEAAGTEPRVVEI